jgi:hypothetical protein
VKANLKKFAFIDDVITRHGGQAGALPGVPEAVPQNLDEVSSGA